MNVPIRKTSSSEFDKVGERSKPSFFRGLMFDDKFEFVEKNSKERLAGDRAIELADRRAQFTY
jgi:hypothetical protein